MCSKVEIVVTTQLSLMEVNFNVAMRSAIKNGEEKQILTICFKSDIKISASGMLV